MGSVDGQRGNQGRTRSGRWYSHVANFWDDYADGWKLYRHGPDSLDPYDAGNESIQLRHEVHHWLCRRWCESGRSAPIDMVGFSRGGYIVMEVARRLKERGCCCPHPGNAYDSQGRSGTKVWPVPVRFLGLYDPVDMAAGFGLAETVPSNVRNAFAVYASFPRQSQLIHPGRVADDAPSDATRSRPYFNRADHGPEDASQTNYQQQYVWATHGGIGGNPWGGDHPTGHSERNDIAKAQEVDRAMRAAARRAGVSIGDVRDYGYRSGD